jgi:pyrroline-5-carboxylate reductase
MKLAVIGAGNMATAIVTGIVKNNMVPAENIIVTDLDCNKLKAISKLKVNVSDDNIGAAKDADIVLIAVKPHIYPAVLEQLTCIDGLDKKIIVTIAPGFSIKRVKNIIGEQAHVVRTMPNTPALVGEGMTVMCYEEPTTEQEYNSIEKLFASFGKTQLLSETLVNEVTSMSGSGPAYVYIMIEAMADAAVYDGIPRNTAYKLAAQTVLGSAKMVLETGKHPGELKDNVCSPGGTTIRAVKVLEDEGFRSSLINAMIACNEKARDM